MAVNKVTERIEKPIMRMKSLLSTENQLIREFLAEFFGTWVLVVFINGSVAQNVFFKRDGYESLLSVNLTVGFALTLAVLAVGKVSGNINFNDK
jgi:glycerol uptake facilitator-like aquaporin